MKVTIKEVAKWMKKLEENRYKKTYKADAKRVAWFVNNQMTENTETMPKSYRKRWSEAKYSRERFLAKEFIKTKEEKLTEQKLRNIIKNIIKEG